MEFVKSFQRAVFTNLHRIYNCVTLQCHSQNYFKETLVASTACEPEMIQDGVKWCQTRDLMAEFEKAVKGYTAKCMLQFKLDSHYSCVHLNI